MHRGQNFSAVLLSLYNYIKIQETYLFTYLFTFHRCIQVRWSLFPERLGKGKRGFV